jgi:hypothetical protein
MFKTKKELLKDKQPHIKIRKTIKDGGQQPS